MRKLFFPFILGLFALFNPQARAACGTITAGMTTSQLQTAISACVSGNTAAFPAGAYTYTGTVNVPNGVSLSGPAVPYSPIHNQTAVFTAGSGFAGPAFSGSSGSGAQTWQYLECNGNEPSPNGGSCFYFPAGVSNVTVTNNFVHGNQGNVSGEYFNAGLIYFDGNASATPDSNITVTNNIVGKPSYGDCSNIMQNYTYPGLGGDGGYCVGLGIHNGVNGLLVQGNIFQFMEQGMKVFEGQGECVNCVIQKNDYNNIHRISFETQANIGGAKPTSMSILWNSIHDQYFPNFGSWGFSSANGCSAGCNTITSENVIINNVMAAGAGGGYTPGAIEIWGSNPGSSTTQNYNLIQGYWANPLDYSSPGAFVSNNNTFCIQGTVVNTAPPPTNNAGGIYFANETENPMPEGPASASGNSFTNTATCPQTSVTPAISPASGSISGTVTVTFTTSGANRDANTGIWYTTDGSTPIPGSGTAKYVVSGGTASVVSPATVKAVGMWGAQNQPTSYPAGYGYLPSAVVTVTYTSGATYYLSPTGSDSNPGTSGSPWLSPNHAVNCGDTIIAASGTYSAGNFGNGRWGTVTCPAGNNVAWLQCATFDTCKITATGGDAMWVDKSYWGVQGWENSTNTTNVGACFHVGPSSGGVIHHVIFANNVANQCMGGGFNAYKASTSASVDYITYLGNVAYNAAQGSGACYSGLNIYEPIAFDSVAGTHNYAAGNFSYANNDGDPCAGTAPTDGEGINFDTWDFSQGGGTPYTQQGAAENNIAVFNGGRGIYAENNAAGGTHAAIFFKGNTLYGNNSQLTQAFCSGNGDLTDYNALNLSATYNLIQTNSATMCTSPQAKFAMAVSTVNASVVFDYNWANGVSGNNTTIFSGGGFAYGSHNVIGTNPSYANPVNPGAPACGGKTNVPNCMATLIANFTPGAPGTSGYGYQTPGPSVTDPLYPAWLCHVVLPAGLVTPGCGGSTPPTLTGGYQGNNGSQNTLAVSAPAVQQIAYGQYSDLSTHTLPDSFGNTPVWTSDTPAVLQVTASGMVSCLAPGTANSVVISSPGGVHFNNWGWTCTPIPPPTITSLTLAATGSVSSINYHATNQILATCHYSDGSTTPCNSVDSHGNVASGWASSSGNVTINSTGLATGAVIGTSNLTAVAGGLTSTPALALAVTSTATLVSTYVTPATNTIAIAGTVQLIGFCHYTTGADQNCTVTDIYGDAVTAWSSATPAHATVGNVGSAHPGLATGVAAGSSNITTTVNGSVTSTPAVVTVSSAPAVTLTGVSLATTGGVTGLLVGQSNSLIATCTYSDLSSDTCTTTDSHGNVASNYISTTPAHASVNNTTGVALGVAAGTTTFTAHAGSFTSPALPLTVLSMPSGTYTITISGPVTITGTVTF